ncbi:MAG: hypothetical protein ACLPID_01645 [Beijerinckiaceae bacterium]
MKTTSTKLLALGVGAAALCASALPAMAATYTEPGITCGAPAGFNPPPGLYFINLDSYGIGQLPGAGALGPSEQVGVGVAAFAWVPGWNFLGASYAASVALVGVEVGIKGTNYLRSPYNPDVNPITLSWNLGNGVGISFGEHIYIPVDEQINGSNSPAGVTSAASFEQRIAISYIGNDWVLSANGIIGIVTKDSAGVQGTDYANLDLTIARTFGKWELGVVAFGAWDINGGPGTTLQNMVQPNNGNPGKDVQYGAGGLLGYNFGPVDLTLKLTDQFYTRGDSGFPKNDVRFWTTIVIPIWNPAPPPRPVIAKY